MNDLIRLCNSIRADLHMLESSVREIRHHSALDDELPGINKSEIRGNAMLAYRHLEDARMRLGKCIQHAEGGVSKFDEPPTTQDR
jgi:hypothetical protein